VRSMPSLTIDAERPDRFGALRSAIAGVRIGAEGAMAGWPVLLGRSGFYVLLMIVLTALWDKVAAERLPGTLVAALPAGGLALYIGVTEWIGLSVPAIHLRLEDDIRSGAVETHLLRPKAYLVQRFAENWGAMLVRMAATGSAALVMLALSGRTWPTPEALAALAVLGPLGGTIGLLLFTIAGLSAFWVRRTVPAFLILQKMLFLLGGLFAPVTLYPAWLTRLAEATPFAAHMFWPASLTITPTTAQMAAALGAQLLWIGLLAGLADLIWRAGLAKVLRGDL
jgi:ABC-2 type transport system permease protein